MNTDKIINKLKEIVEPIVVDCGYELYHIEIVKEDNEDYLRIYIDNSDGISLNDCVKVNKVVSSKLDEVDLIPFSYYLEISSPGIERELSTDKHFSTYIDYNVVIKFKSLFKGEKEIEGILKGFSQEEINLELENGELCVVPRELILRINLKGEY